MTIQIGPFLFFLREFGNAGHRSGCEGKEKGKLKTPQRDRLYAVGWCGRW